VQLVPEPHAAVGVHGARRGHVDVEDPAEAAEARRVEELDTRAQVAGELVLDVVEDGLLVVRREPRPRCAPPPQHLHRPARRLHVEEPRVGPVVQSVGVSVEHVARRRHVREHADVPERVAEPHDVHVLHATSWTDSRRRVVSPDQEETWDCSTMIGGGADAYREEEVVAELQDALQQGELGPDEFNVGLAHVVVGGAEVYGLHLQEVAVWVHGPAVAERLGVDGDDEDVVQEVADPFTGLETLAEEAQQRVGTRERFVHQRDDHCPVVGGHLGQQPGQICKFRLRVYMQFISFAVLAFGCCTRPENTTRFLHPNNYVCFPEIAAISSLFYHIYLDKNTHIAAVINEYDTSRCTVYLTSTRETQFDVE
jgi:hypothetical protein